MKLICIDDTDPGYFKDLKLFKGRIYEGRKIEYQSSFRWKILGHGSRAYFDYRFKEYKMSLSNNIRII